MGLRGREKVVGEVVAALRRASPTRTAVYVVSGSAGQGRTSVLAEAVSAAGSDAVVWIDGKPARGVRQPGPWRNVPLEDLSSEPCTRAEPLRAVVVDDLHALDAEQVRALSAWLGKQAPPLGVLLVSTRSPGEGTPGTELLAHFTDVRWSHLAPVEDGVVWSIVTDRVGSCLPTALRPRITRIAQGIPALADEIGRCLRAEPPDARCIPETVEAVCARAVRTVCLRQLDAGVERAGLLAALIAPEGTAAAAAMLLGADPQSARAMARSLTELGLTPEDAVARRVVRSAAAGWPDRIELSELALVADGYLTRLDAAPMRLLETWELAGPRDERYVELSRRVIVAAAAEGSIDDVRRVAHAIIAHAVCPDAVSWARGVLLDDYMTHDWHEAAATIERLYRPGTRSTCSAGTRPPPAEFGLEAPDAAVAYTDHSGHQAKTGDLDDGALPDAVHRLLVAGQPLPAVTMLRARRRVGGAGLHLLHASGLAVAAFRGGAVEVRLRTLEARIAATSSMLSTGSPFAVYLAATHFATADYGLALEWVTVAGMTASSAEEPSVALSHLVGAQIALRLGEHELARQHADSATAMFAGFGARHLAAAGAATRMLIDVEDRREVTWQGMPLASKVHSLIGSYLTYVHARVQLSHGDVAAGIAGLFETGRHLDAAGLHNPTLLNWRPHLARTFRAGGHETFACTVEDDLLAAMQRWGRANPDAARRGAAVLSPRHSPLRATTAAMSASSPDVLSRMDQLSEAELRVARLIVKGLSNRDVAKGLFLSKRTIDTHLSNIYRKLQIGSRQELKAICGVPLVPQPREGGLTTQPVYG